MTGLIIKDQWSLCCDAPVRVSGSGEGTNCYVCDKCHCDCDATIWTKNPPTEQDFYWRWDGDEGSAPHPFFVLYSGTDDKCFIRIGEGWYGCDVYGGWWTRNSPPPLPKV